MAKDVKPRVRANEADEYQLEKIAILNNLIIAFLLKESVKADMADLNQLYEILRYENMIEVRFT